MSAREAYDEHVSALRAGDIDRVADGYAPDAAMIANGTVYRGRDAIRDLFERSRSDNIIDMELTTEVVIERDLVCVSWRARRDAGPELFGVDTFVVIDGLITAHTGAHVASSELSIPSSPQERTSHDHP